MGFLPLSNFIRGFYDNGLWNKNFLFSIKTQHLAETYSFRAANINPIIFNNLITVLQIKVYRDMINPSGFETDTLITITFSRGF